MTLTAISPAPATPPAPYRAAPSAHKRSAQEHKKALAESYLAVLEKEHLTADWRRRFYPAEERGAQRRVATLKRERIGHIAERDQLTSIFGDATRLDRTRQELQFEGPGMPALYYKDFADRQKYERRDLVNYYQPGQQVLVTLAGQPAQVGRITFFDSEQNNLLRVLLAGQREAGEFPTTSVRRTFR